MKARTIQFISFAAAIGLICLMAWGFWNALQFATSVLRAADSNVMAAVIGGMSTVLVAVIAGVGSHQFARQRQSEEAHRARKVEIYRGFLELVTRMQANVNDYLKGPEIPEKELVELMLRFKTDIMLWASPEVINAFNSFQESSGKGGIGTLVAVDRLYRAIRSDIGLSNRGLPVNSLVKMYLKDPSELEQ